MRLDRIINLIDLVSDIVSWQSSLQNNVSAHPHAVFVTQEDVSGQGIWSLDKTFPYILN